MQCLFCKKDLPKIKHHNRLYCDEVCRYNYNLNKEKIIKTKRKYIIGNCLNCFKKYNKKSKQHVFCSNKCRLSRRMKLNLHQPLQREYFLERFNFSCNQCKNSDNLELHHIIPLYKGGDDSIDNIVVLCEKCHQKNHKIY